MKHHFSDLISPGRGSMEWAFCPTPTHDQQWESNLTFWSSSPPYQLGHMLPVVPHFLLHSVHVIYDTAVIAVLCRKLKDEHKYIREIIWSSKFELFNDTFNLVSVRTFSVMYDHTLFYAYKSPDQTSGHTYIGLSAWWLQMAIILKRSVWVCMG